MKPRRKKNPADATLRNVRTANRRLAVLEQRITDRAADIGAVTARLDAVVRRVDALEGRPAHPAAGDPDAS